MAHLLHLVKDATNRVALDVIARQASDPALRVTVVLLQAAATTTPALPDEPYRLLEGGSGGPGDPGHRTITYAQLLDLIFAADSVVTW